MRMGCGIRGRSVDSVGLARALGGLVFVRGREMWGYVE